MSQRRFAIGFSFPGELRAYVEPMATIVGDRHSKGRVLYDKWYEAEFARYNLAAYLVDLYYRECDLIVVCLCADYEKKRWCQLEWGAIWGVILDRPADVMILCFDGCDMSRMPSSVGRVDVGDRKPCDIADLVLKRYDDQYKEAKPHLVAPTRLPPTERIWVGRQEEMSILTNSWNDPRCNVISVVAPGGIGKTALVKCFRQSIAARGFDSAGIVFDWTFRGVQGVGEGSSDSFFSAIFAELGEDVSDSASGYEKASRLAKRLRSERTLLILDGIESLQSPPGQTGGLLKDPGMADLLTSLAEANQGLCVVTSRQRIAETEYVQPPLASVIELKSLAAVDGGELLHRYGVQGDRSELEEASEAFNGHALALVLLGTYLRDRFEGRVDKHKEIRLLDGAEHVAAHARRMLASYVDWFQSENDELAVAMLGVLGLFDRPIDATDWEILCESPSLAGITESFESASDEDLTRACIRLEQAGLIERDLASSTTSAHQLVFEFFSERAQELNGISWKAAHARLSHRISGMVRSVCNRQDISQLFKAVVHGCLGEEFRDAWQCFLRAMVTSNRHGYAIKSFGMVGESLHALSYFFESTWAEIVSEVPDNVKASMYNLAGFCLRLQGRLLEAEATLSRSIEFLANSNNLANVSEVQLMLGKIGQAKASSHACIRRADREGLTVSWVISRTSLANVLFNSGQGSEACRVFVNAEGAQREIEPDEKYLYSHRGFQFCDLLLEEVRDLVLSERYCGSRLPDGDYRRLASNCLEVIERGECMSRVANVNERLEGSAQAFVILGRASLYGRAVIRRLNDAEGKFGLLASARPELHLEKAEQLFKQSSSIEGILVGLMASAEACELRWYEYHQDRFHSRAIDSLKHPERIATRSQMRLVLAEIELARCRLMLTRDSSVAATHLEKAERIIAECGYARRNVEVANLRAAIERIKSR